MYQADVSKLVSQLKIKVGRRRKLKQPQGPEGRLNKLRKTVTGLIKHERIELTYNRADEARGYAERLISDAIRHGDCHNATMEMADFWLLEKQLVHKLFKVLVPRFENHQSSYTRMYRAPTAYQSRFAAMSVLELKGNPYPSLVTDTSSNRFLIHNVLLDEAKKEYRAQKCAEMADKVTDKVCAEAVTLAGTPSLPSDEAQSNSPPQTQLQSDSDESAQAQTLPPSATTNT